MAKKTTRSASPAPGRSWRGATPAALALVALLGSGCSTLMKPWDDPSPASDSRERYDRIMEAQRRGDVRPADAPPEKTFDGKLREGDQLRDVGDRSSAVWSYLEALRLDPESNEPALRIGYLHLHDDPDRAAAIFQALADEEPDSYRPLLGLGLAHLARARIGDAIDTLEASHALAPDSPAVLATLGVAYQQAGRHDDAHPLLARANELEPGNVRLLNNLGVSYLLRGEPKDAERVFRKALLAKAEDRIVLNNLGLALGRQERYREAKRAFEAANDKKAAANNLGWVYYLNGDYQRALRWYEFALLQPGDGQITILENIDSANAALHEAGPAAPADDAADRARGIEHPRVE
jgi:Flp pilus assembly protein TadD